MACHFARLDGEVMQGPIYFLPWRTSFNLARRADLFPARDFSACYGLAESFVSAEPAACADHIAQVVGDALGRARSNGPPSLVIGYSLGTVPATLLAARLGARLWSFASADRGELMIWSSPATRAIRSEAERMGFSRDDFAAALRRLNPLDWIGEVHPDSRLVVGRFDQLVPRARSQPLVQRARRRLSPWHVLELPLGHLGVLAASPWLQRRWMTDARAGE
jgi:hypothetical protein